ncbi:MAG: SPFH domain-containing protein [Armatimonadetes bacterium]|nr:SPFH domain-containing protein [Armatimonadota bacterium]
MPDNLESIGLWIGAIGIILLFLILMWAASRWRKVGPNQVLVVYGKKHSFRDAISGERAVRGFRIVKGGGTIVWPVIETWSTLSLELMTLDITTPAVYTVQGVPLMVEGVAQIKVKGDDTSIATAAEQFLDKSQQQIADIALQTLEGHLRAIIGTMNVEDIVTNRDAFAQRVQEVSAGDMANMGLTVVSFVIKDIRDTQGYLDAWGRPRIALVKRDAAIAEAEAQRDSTIKSAQANQLAQTAKFEADTKIAESDRDYKSRLAEYNMAVKQREAEADLSYDLQKYKTQQLVRQEEVQVQVIEKQKQIEVQEQEILRREKELAATVEKPAMAERQRIQQLAEAEQYRLQATATGQAEATRSVGIAEADAAKAKGLAEADVTQAKGMAEALAMAKKAEAWQQYTEAAIFQIVAENLPALARAVAEPLSKTEKIIVIGGGDGNSAGASKVTQDVANVIAQLPPMIEALTGMNITEVIKKIPEQARDRVAKQINEPVSEGKPRAAQKSAPPEAGNDEAVKES